MNDYPLPVDLIVETGNHLGYQWVIAKAPAYGLNGYIRIPETQPNHPWENTQYLCDDDTHPWGEVTYQEERWYGFDNHHSWNHWDEEYVWDKTPKNLERARNTYGGHPPKWDTLESTRAQVRHMAEQANEEYTQQVAAGTYTI